MHGYEYLRYITFSLLVIGIGISIISMLYFGKKFVMDKTSSDKYEKLLLIPNYLFAGIILFSFVVMIIDFAYITNFLNRLPKYAIIIPVLIERISYQIFIIYVNEKNK